MENTELNGDIYNNIFLDSNSIQSLNNSEIKILNPMNFNVSNITLPELNPLAKKNNSATVKLPLDRRKTSVKRKHENDKNSNSGETRKVKNEPYHRDNIDESTTSLSFIRWFVKYLNLLLIIHCFKIRNIMNFSKFMFKVEGQW